MGLLSFTWCYNAKYHNPFGGTSIVPSGNALLFMCELICPSAETEHSNKEYHIENMED